jgi:hypothetical protein
VLAEVIQRKLLTQKQKCQLQRIRGRCRIQPICALDEFCHHLLVFPFVRPSIDPVVVPSVLVSQFLIEQLVRELI